MLNKLKKNNKKGFTLVELIVVLVILAILAALLIPALTGYIDRAKEKQIKAETRQAVMAAQTLVDEIYATSTTTPISYSTVTPTAIKGLAEISGTVTFDTTSTTYVEKGLVKQLEYESGGLKCQYTKASADATATYELIN